MKGRPKKTVPTVHKLPPAFQQSLLAALAHGPVELAGFGTFSVVKIPRKILFHNFSQRRRVIDGYLKLKFTQSPEMKATLSR